ncbi:MAG: DNA recombination protein RmuC [bacterium]|nr:DNA recombination protein RmuC [bacterium]
MEILIAVIIGLLVGAFVVYFVISTRRPIVNNNANADELRTHLTSVTQEALRGAQEQFFSLAKETFNASQTAARTDLDNRKDGIEKMINELRKDIVQQQERLAKFDTAHVASFSALKQELEQQQKATSELKGSTDDLKNILSNNQLRGQFGEQIAENLLKMAGFVLGQDYVVNKQLESVDTRPDFTVFMPDKTKINIDVKFPYASLLKAGSATTEQEKQQHLKQFTQDVKAKIKQVTTRDYINAEDKTVDFVIMFIPNEMIFSFIYDQCNELWEESMSKKVVMAGPFTFTAILRMVKQAYTNFRYQENLHHVIGLIQTFEVEYGKFSEAVDVLGDRLGSAVKQYEAVASTRNKKLNKIMDQIKREDVLPENAEVKLIE